MGNEVKEAIRKATRVVKCCTSREDARGSDLERIELKSNTTRPQTSCGPLDEPSYDSWRVTVETLAT